MSEREGSPFVLFVDDTPDILELLAVAARRRGWKVDTASTAEEMLEKINVQCEQHHECFDAVVADIRYEKPGARMDGISALHTVRRKFRNLPFLILSAYVEPLTRKAVNLLGGEVETKPFNPDAVLDRVNTMIELTHTPYKGEERRRRSFNSTGYARRATDHSILGVPEVLARTFERMDARAAAAEGSKDA